MLRIFLLCLLCIPSHELEDDRRIPPFFYDQPTSSDYIGAMGSRVVLRCSAGGIPEPIITWMKDRSEVHPVEGYDDTEPGSLAFPLTSETVGSYKCQAENDYGTVVSQEKAVKVAQMRDPGYVAVQRKSVSEGKSVSFVAAVVNSTPPANVHWYKLPDNTPETNELPLDERKYVDVQGRLWFGYTLKEDTSFNELYKGKCKNAILDQSFSCGIYNLTVLEARSGEPTTIEPSLIYSTPSSYVALENKTMILECFISSRPSQKVTWSRDNRKPLSDRTEMDEWGYRVSVRSVRPEDEGQYFCQSGGTSHAVKVSVEAAPVFLNAPRDLNVTEGVDVVINCSTHAVPSSNVEWSINARVIKKDSVFPRISISDDFQTLLIRSVCRDCQDGRATDSMAIQCRAKNKHGHAFSSSYVNVLKKTEVELTTGESEYVMETGYEKGTIVLNCSARSDPLTPVIPRWYHIVKNHKELLASDSENLFVKDGLLIINLNDTSSKSWKQYHGGYACMADNTYSSSAVHIRITVKGISPVVASIMNYWWIILIALAMLIILVIAIMVQCLYNVGDSYNVNKNEMRNGNNPIKEIEDKDFRIYSRPEPLDFRGSQATLISKSSRDLSDNDGDVYPGRFTEDGSFLGVYTGERQKSFNELIA